MDETCEAAVRLNGWQNRWMYSDPSQFETLLPVEAQLEPLLAKARALFRAAMLVALACAHQRSTS